MDLEKAYDTIDRHGMWQILRVHGVGGESLSLSIMKKYYQGQK